MEVLIVFIAIVCLAALTHWFLSQATSPVVAAFVAFLICLVGFLYLVQNADRIDLDNDTAWVR